MTPSQSKTLSVIKDRERDKTRLSVVGEVADGRFALTNPLSLTGIRLYPVGGWNQMQPPGLKKCPGARSEHLGRGAPGGDLRNVPPALSGGRASPWQPACGTMGRRLRSGRSERVPPRGGVFSPIRCTSSPDVLILRLVEQAG